MNKFDLITGAKAPEYPEYPEIKEISFKETYFKDREIHLHGPVIITQSHLENCKIVIHGENAVISSCDIRVDHGPAIDIEPSMGPDMMRYNNQFSPAQSRDPYDYERQLYEDRSRFEARREQEDRNRSAAIERLQRQAQDHTNWF